MTHVLFVVTIGGYITFSVAVLLGVLIWIFKDGPSSETKKKRPSIHHNSVFVPNSRVPPTGPVTPLVGKSRVELEAKAALATDYQSETTAASAPIRKSPGSQESEPEAGNGPQGDTTLTAGADPYATRPIEITAGIATVVLVGDEQAAIEANLTDDALSERINQMVAVVEKLAVEREDEVTLKDIYRLATDYQASELATGKAVAFGDCFAAVMSNMGLSDNQRAAFESSRQWLADAAPPQEPISALTTIVSLDERNDTTELADMPWSNLRYNGAFM